MGASITKPSSNGEGGKASAAGNNAPGQQEGDPVALPVKLPPSPIEAAPAQPQAQTEQPSPYQLRDLKAQEDMAYWSMWTLFAALGTFFVTAFGTWLIWRQVRLTRMAVEDTSEATDAMREANQISRQAMTAENRAWIEIDVTALGDLRYANGEFRLNVSFTLRNIGRSVALNVSPHAALIHDPLLGMRTIGEVAPAFRSFCDGMGQRPTGIFAQNVFPGRETKHEWDTAIQADEVQMEEIEGVRPDMYDIALAIGVQYQTIFDTGEGSHQTIELGTIRRLDERGRPSLIVVGRQTIPAHEIRLVRAHENLGVVS